jgi:hypothetical protein
MTVPASPKESGSSIELLFLTYDNAGTGAAALFQAGRRTTIDSEQAAAILAEPAWAGTASEPGAKVSVQDITAAPNGTVVLANKANRQGAVLTNVGSETVWLHFSTGAAVAVGEGIPLLPYGSLVLGPTMPYYGPVSATHSDTGNTHDVTVVEF